MLRIGSIAACIGVQPPLMQNIREVGFLELLNEHGRPVFLDSVWRDRLSVMTLTRHFGCLFCIEQISGLCAAKDELTKLGAELVVVGNGNPAHAADFMRRFGLTRDVFTDPARTLYKRLGLVHGLRSTINWTATRNARRAVGGGFRQESVQGDRWQQGGTFVIGPAGDIHYSYRSAVAGDHASVDQILRSVRDAAVRRAE